MLSSINNTIRSMVQVKILNYTCDILYHVGTNTYGTILIVQKCNKTTVFQLKKVKTIIKHR